MSYCSYDRLVLPGHSHKVSHSVAMTSEQCHHVVQPLLPGVVQRGLGEAVLVSGVSPVVQQESTHVHTATGSCIVQGGAVLGGGGGGLWCRYRLLFKVGCIVRAI